MKKVRFLSTLLCAMLLCACQPGATQPQGGLSPAPAVPQAPPADVSATQLELAPDLLMTLYLDPDRWQISKQPPEWLVDDTAEHLEHELADQGRYPSAGELETLARKRLGHNEVFIYNLQSGAHLEVDVGKLREDESAPSALTVQRSAEYAGESLGSEEGVSGLSFETENLRITGTKAATLLHARYRHHDEPQRFLGVVAFSSPYWAFLYYTDPLHDPADYEAMETALRTFSIRPTDGSGK